MSRASRSPTVAGASCGFAAIACALVALWLYVLPQVGPTGAPLVVAGSFSACASSCSLSCSYGLRPRPPPAAGVAPSVLIAEATRLINENKGTVLLAALLAGLVAGSRGK